MKNWIQLPVIAICMILFVTQSMISQTAVHPSGSGTSGDIGKLRVLAGVHEFPERVKCATLAWHTMKAALENLVAPVSTE